MPPEIWAVARRLVDATVHDIRIAGSGANSAVYRIDCADASYALKRYPAADRDPRDRCGTEWRALCFLVARGVEQVPHPIRRDADGRFMLMEWIQGTQVKRHEPGDIEDAARFMEAVFDLSSDPEAVSLPPASEACLSARAIVEQIERRKNGLVPHERVDAFLCGEFRSAYERAVAQLPAGRAGAVLPEDFRRLVPADFGFHNALRRPDGGLRYVDFDYFGWDDPVKTVADFILHPAMALSGDDAEIFVKRLAPALDDDFLARLRDYLPLFAARWALILLNAFRADHIGPEPREAAAMERALDVQLDKARGVLARGDTHAATVRRL